MKPSTGVRASVSADGIILLDITTGRIFSANPIGARIWSGLEAGLPLPIIVERIAGDTGADRAVIERDAAAFVEALKARGLIVDAPLSAVRSPLSDGENSRSSES